MDKRFQSHSRRRGLVVSDLHLFAPRSDGTARFEHLSPQSKGIQTLILNGDTFDFRWSKLPDHAASVVAALAWLEDLLRQLPQCDIHFVLGNHDCLQEFTQRLPGLADSHPTFHWHEQWLQLGNAIFLHGDCAQQRMNAADLERYRAVWRADRRGNRFAAKLYGWADRLGLTRLAHHWSFPRRRTLDRVVHYLHSAWPDWKQTTKDCYFGHTHLPFSAQVYQGVSFTNTGSAIRGMAFNPCWFDLTDSTGRSSC